MTGQWSRRRIFMAGLVIFAGASLACALAADEAFLIVMRGVQGLGAAMVLPSALSIVMNMFSEGAERNKALGLWGSIGASGATVGLLAGGALTRYAGWQYIFYLNVAIGGVALVLTRPVVPESRLRGVRRRYDALGALAVTGGLVALVYAISQAPAAGWTATRTLALLAAAAVMLVTFPVIELRAEAPLLPLRLFRLKTLAGSNAVGFLLGASFFSFIFIGTLYMQQVLGYSAMKTGLAWLATSLTGVALAGPAQTLVTRASAKLVMAVGMTLVGAGILWATQVPVHGTFWVDLAGPFFITGACHLGVHPGIDRSAGRRDRARRRRRLWAPQHVSAAWRGDRRRRHVNRGSGSFAGPRRPGPRCRGSTHRGLPVGTVGGRPRQPLQKGDLGVRPDA
jgi:MFS family permease